MAKERAGAALSRWLPSLARAYRESLRGERRNDSSQRASAFSRSEIEAAGAALLRLQRGLTGERGLAGAPYMDDSRLLGAYLLYYWPVSYLQASLALAELGLGPRRVLDLGAGPGPVAAAALDAGAAELVLADGSERSLELARHILGRDSARVETLRADLESSAAFADIAGPFDLVVLGHCVNELWRGRGDRAGLRLGLLERATSLLAPGGVLLVLEPALLETSREALALRDALAAAGYAVLGPCPAVASGSYACPALAAGPDRTCHAEAAWDPPESIASLARAAGLDRRSVKYTWFAVGASSATPTAGDARPSSGDAAEADGLSLAGRIVSDPMLNKAGRVRYFLCAEGRLASLSAPRGSPSVAPKGRQTAVPESWRPAFFSLRRGDRVRVRGAEARAGGGLGLGPASSLELLGRAPTP